MVSNIEAIGRLPLLSESIRELKSLSLDDIHRQCMTNSQIKAIAFDGVKNAYVAPLGLSDIPCSLDAICLFENDLLVFVEFKNGSIDSREAHRIRKKVYDTLLIFQDLTSIKIEDLRQCAELVLVYRSDLNLPKEGEFEKPLQNAPSRESIQDYIFRLGNTENIRFDLEQFQSYCFKSVHTYSPEEFEDYLKGKESIL